MHYVALSARERKTAENAWLCLRRDAPSWAAILDRFAHAGVKPHEVAALMDEAGFSEEIWLASIASMFALTGYKWVFTDADNELGSVSGCPSGSL